MLQWECIFRVDGIRTETTVSARSGNEAKKFVEAQYAGSKSRGSLAGACDRFTQHKSRSTPIGFCVV